MSHGDTGLDSIFTKPAIFEIDETGPAQEIANKISIARGSLILDQPFFGYVLGQFKIFMVKDGIDKFCADKHYLYFNTKFMGEIIERSNNWKGRIKGMLIHLLLHLLFRHHKRQKNKIAKLWGYAADVVVFQHLMDISKDWIAPGDWELPKLQEIPEKFRGYNVEKTYKLLYEFLKDEIEEKETNQSQGNQENTSEKDEKDNNSENTTLLEQYLIHNSPEFEQNIGLKGNICDIEEILEIENSEISNIEELEDQYFEGILRNAYEKQQSFGSMPGNFDRFIRNKLKPQINWKAKLVQFLQKTIVHDLSWTKPNKRLYGQGYYLPGPIKENTTVVLGIDTSGSISDEVLGLFLSEAQNILETIINIRLIVIDCDADIQQTTIYETGESVRSHKFKGKGGTDFRPVLNSLHKYNPDVCIYITDGYGEYPEKEPDVPIIWVLTTEFVPPFGEHIRLETI